MWMATIKSASKRYNIRDFQRSDYELAEVALNFMRESSNRHWYMTRVIEKMPNGWIWLAQKVTCISSAGADDLKIAQRFIAGVRLGNRFSPRSGRLKAKSRISITAEISETLNFSRPFHGLICKPRIDPSAKVLGYCHSVRFADDTNSAFWAKLLH